MKKLVLILALAGCSYAKTPGIISPSDGVVYTAAQSLGLHERKNRQELKELLGVDPVRYEWCAAFVNSILRVNNIPGSDSVSDYPLTARSFMNWGEPAIIPERGDIVVFPRGNQGWQGHVGFYMKSVYIDNREYYMILGGNQDNQVSFELYPANKAIAIRRQAGYWSEY